MKLYLKLHATAELHTDTDTDSAAETIKTALGVQFTGKESEDGWMLSRIDRNFFRPAIRVRLLPDEDGTLIWTDFKPDKTLLLFMAFWSAVVIALAVWKGLLMLVMLPVFWAFVFIGFASGVKKGKQDLTDLFGAYEILD